MKSRIAYTRTHLRLFIMHTERKWNMSEKRKDSKGRILKTGESQRPDGRYAYKFTDASGRTQFVYSWKLVLTDPVPNGKRRDISLREKEKEIQRDMDDGIDTAGKKMTVCGLYAKQTGIRSDVVLNTKRGRQRLMELLSDDPLGSKRIDSVKLSDAKEWVARMHESGYAYKTISNYKRALKAAFYTALNDDMIRKNPFDFDIKTVLTDDTTPKVILTREQEETLVAFAQSDSVYRKYADEIIILLNTGLRISELCGLTVSDIDFENQKINVDHQLLRDTEIGYYINRPKTKKGIRQIPMLAGGKAYGAFQRVIENRADIDSIEIDGYKDFLFLNRKGYPKVACDYKDMLNGLVKKYNKKHTPSLPHISPHSLRHTFCSRMANAGMNPKALQYIMGHSNISMTLDYYTHVSIDDIKKEMARFGI